MTLRDTIVISAGNLRRMKLRTFLTTSGVLIAIAAFVAMLSFGAGNQQNIEREFNKLGLFSTMQVFPKGARSGEDAPGSPALDHAALDRLAQVPGVNLVYPYDALAVEVTLGDSTVSSRAQALPAAAARTKLFSDLLAGTPFDSNSSSQVIVSDELLKKLGVERPDSALGLSLVLSVRVSTIDSGLAHILVDRGESLLDRLKRIHFDSLLNSKYRSRVIRTEADEMLRRFVNGIINARELVRDTLVVCGVRQTGRVGRIRTEPVIIPVGTVQPGSPWRISDRDGRGVERRDSVLPC